MVSQKNGYLAGPEYGSFQFTLILEAQSMVNLTSRLEFPRLVSMTNKRVKVATVVNIYEAKTNLSDLVERAAAGEEVIIAKAGVPKVKLVPVPQPGMVREAGHWKGRVWMAPDWDAPASEEELRDWYRDSGV